MANASNYEIDTNDPRLTDIKSEEATELSDLEQTYADMAGRTDEHYDAAIQGAKDYEKAQTDLANENLSLTVQEIEQNKADTRKDYIKEQSGAFVDWQRQSNKYGVNAEKMASSGLTGTGYSETSQVGMYNAYQYRIATAREVFDRANVDYDKQIAQAQLANDTLLAEIAYKSLVQRTELALEHAQYKNQLLIDLTEKKSTLKQSFYQRYLAMMEQIANEANGLGSDRPLGTIGGGGSSGGDSLRIDRESVSNDKTETKPIPGLSTLPSNTAIGNALGLHVKDGTVGTGGGSSSGKTISEAIKEEQARQEIIFSLKDKNPSHWVQGKI